MEIFDIIKRRRTIRSFKNIPVEREKLKLMVEAGRLAPSGGNLQPVKFIVVDSSKFCDLLFPHLRWAGYTTPYGVPTKEDAPRAYIIVLTDLNIRKDADNDASYAEENIVLLAESMGISSCIIGSVLREEVEKIFNIPDTMKIHTVIALGYPNQESFVFDMEDSVKYYLDENNNFHVPKRKTEDIVKYF
ncbi:MAG: nitroreductase family protein [Clostridia bacterium]|nr:nitroreductase family protein [Clostridia bacterium]